MKEIYIFRLGNVMESKVRKIREIINSVGHQAKRNPQIK